ncbi:MAG: chymotrypsin family serine protease, partial [Planctomycetota bacterium]
MSRRTFWKVLLAVVVIFALSVLSSVLSAQGRSDAAFERVKQVQEKHTKRLLATEGVEGTAVGFGPKDRLAVKVFTAKSGVSGIPKKLDDVPTHVVVTGKFYALRKPPWAGGNDEEAVDPTARLDRPVPIGVSTGHRNITAGTIGCRVRKNGDVYALSNNHVYADENAATIGDNVLQPGTFDGGVDPDDSIGTLSDFEPIVFSLFANNVMDAAIARSSDANLSNATPSDGYGKPKSATLPAGLNLLNMSVKKYGRTTRLTKGKVYAVNATVNVGYGTGTARFVN